MEPLTLLIIGLIIAMLLGVFLLCFLVTVGVFALPLLLTAGGYWLDWFYDSLEHFFTYWRGGDGGNGML